MTLSDSHMRITLRAIGRLLVAGTIGRELAAMMVRHAWARCSFDLLPSETTGNSNEPLRMAVATASDHWCVRCREHRAERTDGLCPLCLDDDRRGRVVA
jgi:hypothetical protein